MPSRLWQKKQVLQTSHHETDVEDDAGVFHFDKNELFGDSACEDLSGADSDGKYSSSIHLSKLFPNALLLDSASNSTVRHRPHRTNALSKFNPTPGREADLHIELAEQIPQIHQPSPASSDDDASPNDRSAPRLSFAEPADISQVLAIHDFIAGTTVPTDAATQRKAGLTDFEPISVIGKGAYGKVFLVRKREADQERTNLYAMKVLRKASIVLHGKDAEHTKNERTILEEVRHPFIVTLHYAFQTQAKLYLILSYASGGELFTYLANEKMFSEDVARFYLAELLLALEHLHELGIIYRDLKPENVLLNATGHVLLTDFGLSKVALDARTVCGTIEFMAPEVLDDHRAEGYDKMVDYWSLGVMMFDMLTGSPPFTGNNRKKIMDGILKKKIVWPKYMTAQARDLCNKLLQKNPAKRLGAGVNGATQVKQHNFFRKMDWVKLAKLEVTPPLVPELSTPDDTSNFDAHFTTMPPMDSPCDIGLAMGDVESDPFDHFAGFSYVAESAFLK